MPDTAKATQSQSQQKKAEFHSSCWGSTSTNRDHVSVPACNAGAGTWPVHVYTNQSSKCANRSHHPTTWSQHVALAAWSVEKSVVGGPSGFDWSAQLVRLRAAYGPPYHGVSDKRAGPVRRKLGKHVGMICRSYRVLVRTFSNA